MKNKLTTSIPASSQVALFLSMLSRIRFRSPLLGVLAVAFLLLPAASKAQTLFALSGSDLYSLNLSTGVATPGFTTVTGLNSGHLELSGNALYLVDGTAGTIAAYNATTGAPLAGFTTIIDSGGPAGLAVSGGVIYVTNSKTNSITAYDAATGAALAGYISPSGLVTPAGVAIAGGTLYVGDNSGAGIDGFTARVKSFSLATGVATPGFAPINADQFGVDLVVSGNGLYVANPVDEFVDGFDATTGAPLAGFTNINSISPAGMGIVGGTLYIGSDSGGVRPYDAATGALLAGYTALPFGSGSRDIAIGTPVSAPEPTSAALLGFGSLLLTARRRQKSPGK